MYENSYISFPLERDTAAARSTDTVTCSDSRSGSSSRCARRPDWYMFLIFFSRFVFLIREIIANVHGEFERCDGKGTRRGSRDCPLPPPTHSSHAQRPPLFSSYDDDLDHLEASYSFFACSYSSCDSHARTYINSGTNNNNKDGARSDMNAQ